MAVVRQHHLLLLVLVVLLCALSYMLFSGDNNSPCKFSIIYKRTVQYHNYVAMATCFTLYLGESLQIILISQFNNFAMNNNFIG